MLAVGSDHAASIRVQKSPFGCNIGPGCTISGVSLPALERGRQEEVELITQKRKLGWRFRSSAAFPLMWHQIPGTSLQLASLDLPHIIIVCNRQTRLRTRAQASNCRVLDVLDQLHLWITCSPGSKLSNTGTPNYGRLETTMIKSTISPALRPLTANAKSLLRAQPLLTGRHYATSGAESRRRSVTPFNDDGHVPWSELSAAEKTGRTAQQTFNFGLVLAGVLLTASVPGNDVFPLSLPRRQSV